MSIQHSLHSNATSFLSFLEHGVDPRTGQYTLHIALPDLLGNDLQSPDFRLQLNFNPLNVGDSGYGSGWNLNLSQYTGDNQVLSLHSGESFKLEDSNHPSGRLAVPEQKLASFNVYPMGGKNLHTLTGLRVMHRSGLVEILKLKGNVALPTEIYSPQGQKLLLDYTAFGTDQWLLDTVTDGLGTLLLQVQRVGDSTIDLLVRPFTGEDGEPLARYKLGLENRLVTRITLPGEHPGRWQMRYQSVLGLQCISGVRSPAGAWETLYYLDSGHQFPASSGRRPLPRVTRHTLEPGEGQPMLDTRYSYELAGQTNNFLGAGSGISWDESGLDNLYKIEGDYKYGSEETQYVDNQPVRSVARTFNRFHLLTEQVTSQGNAVLEEITTYPITDGPFAKQFNACQQPIRVLRRWRQRDGLRPPRSEESLNSYHGDGNLRTRQAPNQVVETSEWYDPAGEDGCPADPEGFSRHLKQKTTTPAPADGVILAAAPTLIERYRYTTLPRLDDASHDQNDPDQDWKHQPWHVLRSEALIEKGNEEKTVRYTRINHINSKTDAFLHGRRYLQVQTLNGLETATEYYHAKVPGSGIDREVLQTRQVVIGYDGSERSTVAEQSMLNGQVVSQTDEHGVYTRTEYDALARVIRSTVAPGTEFEASRTYQYAFYTPKDDDEQAKPASQTVISARGVKTLTVLDGLARVIEERRDHIHTQDPQRMERISAVQFNALGQQQQQTDVDWMGQRGTLAVTQTLEYDEWGQQQCVIGPDGVRHYSQTDPLGNSEHRTGPVLNEWSEVGNGSAKLISGATQTWLNPFEKPDQVHRLDANGVRLASRAYAYDGLGRALRETDERNLRTEFTYDCFGRMLSTTLPDKTRVQRDYAAHTDAELPTLVFVTPGNTSLASHQLGSRYYDGLDRLIIASSGPRVEHFEYQDGESQPRRRITAAGKTIAYDYDFALTTEPKHSLAEDSEANFAFNKVSARITGASTSGSGRGYDYNPANQLVAQHWDDATGRKGHSRTYQSSVHDRLLGTLDDKGGSTVVEYDDFGRQASTTQGQLSAGFVYDRLGRHYLTATRDGQGNSLETEIGYDDQDREITRTWRQAGQAERTLTQQWLTEDLLEWRELRQGSTTLLKETFKYDTNNRLTEYKCTGSQLPRDELGRTLKQQTFSFDAYDNISITVTQFADGSKAERAQYQYAYDDPCQLRSIKYTPARSTGNPQFTYDANGNLTRDAQGRTLRYDSHNRLLGVAQHQYRYDGHGHLQAREDAAGKRANLYFEGDRLSLAVHGGVYQHYCYVDDQPLSQQRNDGSVPVLLQTTASHSIVAESLGSTRRDVVYTAYGAHASDNPPGSGLGYNGEALDPATGWYLLGNGYRAYDPTLMRFLSPDTQHQSPFGEAGLNYYSYVRGNPISFRDPTGEAAIGWSGRQSSRYDDEISPGGGGTSGSGAMGWVFVGLAVLGVIVAGVFAGSALAGVKGAVAGAAAGTVTATAAAAVVGEAVAATIALSLTVASTVSQIVNTVNPENETAGQLAMYLGIAATAVGLFSGGLKFRGKIAKRFNRSSVGKAAKGLVGPSSRKPSTTSLTSTISGGIEPPQGTITSDLSPTVFRKNPPPPNPWPVMRRVTAYLDKNAPGWEAKSTTHIRW